MGDTQIMYHENNFLSNYDVYTHHLVALSLDHSIKSVDQANTAVFFQK